MTDFSFILKWIHELLLSFMSTGLTYAVEFSVGRCCSNACYRNDGSGSGLYGT